MFIYLVVKKFVLNVDNYSMLSYRQIDVGLQKRKLRR